MQTVVSAPLAFTPLQRIVQPRLVLEDGRLVRVGSRDEFEAPPGARVCDYPDGILAPGFIDLHLHGAAGRDVMEATPEALAGVERFLARRGVTAYLPTTVTAPWEDTLQALDGLSRAIQGPPTPGRARPLALHLEGPFLSHAKRGVHPAEHLVEPNLPRWEQLWEAAGGRVGMMTIAPEVPGAVAVIEAATRRGVRVSLGHSNSSLAEARAGITAGACHATHTFNAMRPLDHREPGILGAVLTDARLTADLIADGIHVDAALIGLFLRAKGPAAAILISDGISATGQPDGTYHLGQIEVEVRAGHCLSNGTLAGSVLTLDQAMRNVMRFAGWELQETLRLITLNPATRLGLHPGKGELVAGADADLVVLDAMGMVQATWIAGQPI